MKSCATGDVRSVNLALASVTRVSWFVGAMLLAIAAAWLVVEAGIIRRIAELTRRACSASADVRGAEGAVSFNVADLRGADELGILAGVVRMIWLHRVNEDLRREYLRTERERDTPHAVGHEIMSPLQSLMVLHGKDDDPSGRYIHRMQQAIRVLYGSASLSERHRRGCARTLDLNEFLGHVAANAQSAGVTNVQFTSDNSRVCECACR